MFSAVGDQLSAGGN